MRRPILLTVALALALSSCAAESPEPSSKDRPDTPTSRPSTAAPAEPTSSTTAAKADPLAKQSAPGRCPNYADNSPAVVDLAAGTYAVLISDFPSADGPVTFDVVQWMTGEQARDQYRRSHPDDPEGPPNDYYIHNESERTRSAPLRSEVQIWLVGLSRDASSLKEATVEELHTHVSAGSSMNLFWLTFERGAIVQACEQYVP